MKKPCYRCGTITEAFMHYQPWCGCASKYFKLDWELVGEFKSLPGLGMTHYLARMVTAMPCVTACVIPKVIQKTLLEEVPGINIAHPYWLYSGFSAMCERKEPSYAKLLLALPKDVTIAFLPMFVCKDLNKHTIWLRNDITI